VLQQFCYFFYINYCGLCLITHLKNKITMDFKQPHNSQRRRSDWFDWWLADEAPAPAAREEIRRFRVKQANTYKRRGPSAEQTANHAATQPNSDGKSLVINLSIPKIKLPKLNYIKITTKNNQINLKINDPKALAVVVCSAALALLVLGHLFSHHSPAGTTSNPEIAAASSAAPTTTSLSGAQSTTAQAPQTAGSSSSAKTSAKKLPAGGSSPDFTPAVPVTKPDLANSPPVRSAYDASRGVYTVMDTFKGAPVTINEQKLASSDPKSAQDAVKQNADQISAKDPVTLANGSTAYMITDSKTGSQTIIFAVRNVLIYVNSLASHTNSDWRDYLNLFQ
jgi:hypothetical protein